ncbi:MAG: 4-hydroxythreonine-4-phosphate dehydrogenase PdxA [Spirochaetota bacterium]
MLPRKARGANNPPVIGITLGDPAGVGPEVALRSLTSSFPSRDFVPVLIGRRGIIQRHYPSFDKYLTPASPEQLHNPDLSAIYIDDIESADPVPDPGKGSILTARESLRCIDRSIELWSGGIIDAVVTGPVNKGLIEQSGTPFMGHTEYYAEKTGGTPYMMMFSAEYRVLLVTTHCAIDELPAAVTEDAIYRTIAAGHKALSRIDGKAPRIAVCGRDPHCGDHGAISTFDDDVTSAAVARAKNDGICVQGPVSADTVFLPSKWKSYQLVIAHYHDQGLIPFKICAFDSGVNVTLGLDIVRTSVDHGTAFDIAGKNCAGYESMSEAIRLARRLASMRNQPSDL